MPPAEFELTIPANERPQTLALDRSATEISKFRYHLGIYLERLSDRQDRRYLNTVRSRHPEYVAITGARFVRWKTRNL